jgi:catechol 2,3-dioxygenase-like lactoylglutathione lyase family enzyme
MQASKAICRVSIGCQHPLVLPFGLSLTSYVAPLRVVRPIEHHMLHHLSFAVADLARSGAFYDAVLAPLGYGRV